MKISANKFVKTLMFNYFYYLLQQNIHLILGDGQKTS